MTQFTIYAALAEGDLRYVGKTEKSLEKRLEQHLVAARGGRDKSYRAKWIRSLLRQGIRLELRVVQIIECALEEANEAERYWIDYFRKAGCRLVNQTSGGDGISGYRFSKEARSRMSASRKGRKQRPFREETKRKMSEAAKRRWASPEERRSASVKMTALLQGNTRRKGKKDKIETSLRKSKARGGRPFVDQFGRRYETQRSAARLLGLSQGDVGRVLAGKFKQIKGFVFKYVVE